MQINEKILEMKSKLPIGAMRLIAKETGLTERTIGNFFNGNKTRFESQLKIMPVAKRIIKEHTELYN